MVDNLVLAGCFAQTQAVQDFGLYLILADGTSCLALTALVDDEIMCDAHKPGTELAARLVLMGTNCHNSTRERLLEEVVGNIAVFYQKEDIGINVRLMASEQNVECTIVACFIQFNQLMVGHCR